LVLLAREKVLVVEAVAVGLGEVEAASGVVGVGAAALLRK